ncbi:hypothetical protein CupriaWKF_24515 [Cupriavidus sp. WKF15]|uniref:hypothetical protein n=1 Tax=Cupriavidus sp. WKF15 TaxID=3032282 RepID=UPI0023E20987|nr:hypothetical protein [Cupriavidus sp. WKF15]WER47979.1 hypothetical protein CupriaWKF_24515 [Cupriavidus sp. WKF15]
MTHPSSQASAAPDKGESLGRTVISVARHRSLDRLNLSAPTLAGIVLVPLLFNAVEWLLHNYLSAGWTGVFAFWLGKLEIQGVVAERLTSVAGFDLPLPHLDAMAALPDLETWCMTAALTIAAGLLTLRLPARMLPLRYFLLFALFIQLTALAFFAVVPEQFPYTVSSYIDNGMKTAVGFLVVLPWAHALVYYVFDFSWSRKIALTAMTLAFIVVAVPLQLLLHVYVVQKFSLLWLPVLSFVFGPTLIVFGCIALYGWGMSWKRLRGRK